MCDVVFAGCKCVKINVTQNRYSPHRGAAHHIGWACAMASPKSDIYQLTCTSRMLRLARQMTSAQQVSISMKSNSKCSVNIPHSSLYVLHAQRKLITVCLHVVYITRHTPMPHAKFPQQSGAVETTITINHNFQFWLQIGTKSTLPHWQFSVRCAVLPTRS